MAREHEGSNKGKGKETSKDIQGIKEYITRMCKEYEQGEFLDVAMFYRL